MKPVEGGPKLVHVTFQSPRGPRSRSSDIDFVGNQAISDGSLGKKMKENKGEGFFGFITGGGTYKEDKFAEDAQLITDHYRDEGYIMAQVGQPQMKTLEDSKDGKTRWIQLQVPITEGKRYAVGDFNFEGNKVVKPRRCARSSRSRPARSTARRRSRRASRRRRRSTAPAATSSSPRIPIAAARSAGGMATARLAAGPPSPGPASARGGGQGRGGKDDADRRRDDAGRRRQAVLHQPHHLHGQYDDARQRHPPRDADPRGRRVQHAGAQGQRQAPQPARLLQAARRRGGRRPEDRRTPTTRSTSGSSSKSRTATS